MERLELYRIVFYTFFNGVRGHKTVYKKKKYRSIRRALQALRDIVKSFDSSLWASSMTINNEVFDIAYGGFRIEHYYPKQ